jgi:hypothetical protein
MNPPPASSQSERSLLQRITVWLVTLLCTVLVCSFLVLLFGQVSGTEFSPNRFRRRRFDFLQIPVIKLQISPVMRDDATNELEKYLRRKGLITQRATVNRWDVVSRTSGSMLQQGDANILIRYLDLKNEDRKFLWLEWTKQHPELAAPFWAAVHEAAVLQAYFFVPELFELAAASEGQDADQFVRALDDLLADHYARLAEDVRQLGQLEWADRYYAAALEHDPENESLRSRRAELQQGKPS